MAQSHIWYATTTTYRNFCLLMLLAWQPLTALAEGAAGTSADSNADREHAAISQLYTDWRLAVAAASIPRYLQALHPQVRLLPPGAEPIVGAQNYGKFLQPVFASADYQLEVLKAPQIVVLGDVATAEYEYMVHLSLKDPQQGVDTPGALTAAQTHTRYFDVLRRNDQGQWGVWRHTWHVLEQ